MSGIRPFQLETPKKFKFLYYWRHISSFVGHSSSTTKGCLFRNTRFIKGPSRIESDDVTPSTPVESKELSPTNSTDNTKMSPQNDHQELSYHEEKHGDDDHANNPVRNDTLTENISWQSNLSHLFSKQDIDVLLSLPPQIKNVRLQLVPVQASDPDLANVAYIDAEFLPQQTVTIGRGTFESLSQSSRFDLSYISRRHARLDCQEPNKL